MEESNTRMPALLTNSASVKSEDSLSPLNVVENNKNIQHFDTIRDPHKSMVRLIDTIFDYLQFYADEENKTNDDPHLSVHWQRPILEKQKNNKHWLKDTPDLPAFKGKLYTRDWSLIVKGTDELITSYVIPSNRVISFNSEPEIYSPYLTINYKKHGSNYGWQIDKEKITVRHLDTLAKKLLERLLKSARSQEWSQSVFGLESVDTDSTSLEKENSKSHCETVVDPEQFLIDLMTVSGQSKLVSADIITEPSSTSETSQISSKEKCESVHPELTFEMALKLLPNLIDQRLRHLSQEGSEAFSKHDLKSAQDLLTLSNSLSEFKNKVKEIMIAFKIQH